MRIPENTIDEVRNASDIVEIIAGYVHLKKRGKNYLGLCPFHTEKTPSFTVSADKQMYHCFGCGKGGNVFTFLMEMDKVSFVEAVRVLASKANIQVPEESQQASAEQSEFEQYFAACRFAGMYFYRNLTETEEGKEALQYFHKRGFSDETIRTFGLGYAMNSWDTFTQKALAEGLRQEDLLKVGLVRVREDGSAYDYFRGRAMFPVFSAAGRVIAFGARKLREDDPIQGKYINSPETPIYNKSRVLYGLFHSKEAIRQEDNALMVEGYADLISLYQAGFQNVVASSGTALTEDQLHLIGRYTKNLTLVYDADTAGSDATVRGIDLALERDMNVRIVELPEGEDPDSFIQNYGGQEFRARLEQAVSFIHFKAKQLQRTGAFATAEGKAQAVRSLVQSIAKIKDELKRTFFIKEVAEKYDVYESLLLRELERLASHEKRTTRFEEVRKPQQREQDPGIQVPRVDSKEIPAEERDILKLILEGDDAVIRFVLSNISVDQITHQNARTLAHVLLDIFDVQGTVNASSVVNEIEDPVLKALLTDLALSRYELSHKWQEMEKEIDQPDPMKIAKDAIITIRKKTIHKEMEENQRALKEAHHQQLDAAPYLMRQQELMQLMKQVEALRV